MSRWLLTSAALSICALGQWDQEPPQRQTPISSALAALTRLASVRLGAVAPILTSGTLTGSELVIVAEVAPTAIEARHWQGGGNVTVVATDPTGRALPTTRAHFNAGERSAIVRIPASGREGSWEVSVQVRGSGEPAFFDRLTLLRSATSILGDALVFRAMAAAAARLEPAAALQFRRTERIRLEFPVFAPLDRRDARLLDVQGQPLAVALTVTERATGGNRALAIDLSLAPLAPSDYVIEVTALAGKRTDRRMLAIRLAR